MPLIFSPSANSLCDDWDNNFNILNTALVNSEILQQGLMLNTRIDGTSFNVPIPWFNNFIKTGTLALQASPNANLLDYTILTYQINALPFTVTPAGTIVLNAGDPVLPRVDVVYLTTTNAIVYLVGVAAINPVSPAIPPNTLVATYIGVDPLANNLGGYTLTQVNLTSNTAISPGFIVNQTLRWSGASWVPTNSMFTNAFGQVAVGNGPGFGIMDAATKLQVNGAIQIIDIGIPPAPPTNKLYAIAGSLYWNGFLLTGYTGTVVGSHLVWNGVNFVEQTDFLTLTVANNAKNSKFISNDTIGINTLAEIGKATGGDRGFLFQVTEPLNDANAILTFTQPVGSTAEYDMFIQDNSTGAFSEINAQLGIIQLESNNAVTNSKITINNTQTIINSGLATKIQLIIANTILSNQHICAVRTSIGIITLTLPLTPTDGTEFIIKDADNNAFVNNITINPNGATIDSIAGNLTISSNRQAVTMVYQGSLNSWFII